jgi:DNA mismatch repair protein MutL
VGKPQLAKKSRTNQYFFLNNRSIVSKSLNHAVFSALEHLLDKSSNPFFIINIALDPKAYDVNVHPQKHEVKFEDERIIYSAIRRAVSNALASNQFAPSFLQKDITAPFVRFNTGDIMSRGGSLVNQQTGEIIEPGNSSGSTYERHNSFNWKTDSPINTRKNISTVISAFDEVFGRNDKISIDNNLPTKEINKYDLPDSEKFFWQLHTKYIFAQTSDGCIIIDQHAAHERILYEKAIKMMDKEFAQSQQLIFPIDINLSDSEVSVLQEISSDLTNLGYSFELLENNKVIIYEEYQKIRNTNKRDSLAASFACKSAIKTGQKLSQQEMLTLYHDLMNCDVPYACPHGRPVILNLSLNDFDKKFGRML